MRSADERNEEESLGWAETASRYPVGVDFLDDHPRLTVPPAEDLPDLSSLSGPRRARALIARTNEIREAIPRLLEQPAAHRKSVSDLLGAVREGLVVAHLETLPVDRIKDATEGRLRLGPLVKSGFSTVAALYAASPHRLMSVPGIGEQTANQAVGAARHIARTARETIPVRFDVDRRPAGHTVLLGALRSYDDAARVSEPLQTELTDLRERLGPLADDAAAARRSVKWFFTRGARRVRAIEALDGLEALLRHPETRAADHRLRQAFADLGTGLTPDQLWADFTARSPEYYGLLGEIGGLAAETAATHGHIPAELAEAIAAQPLDTSMLTVSLRGYQQFGAKFALRQQRTILGDEMGLGKTIEALAVMTHLAAHGASHFLVVCPASVTVNWAREVTSRSCLAAHRIHGPERDTALKSWLQRGGVGVTTFDTLRHVPLPDQGPIGALVVDEAHYVKNPATKRAADLQAWTGRIDRVLFLTGTPMENRVEEFRNLVGYLQPELAQSLQKVTGLGGADRFRTEVASAYLRRNQEDVLAELPERIDVEEWVAMTGADFDAYRRAVSSRNFMAMRRATLMAGGEHSAKHQRLSDILAESEKEGWKVVVFSYFRDVLDVVGRTVGPSAHGPLTGSTPAAQRQALVDGFSAAPGHAVLLSQIQAGGTGLNMQAANVVVLTEPQWKPSIEDQAVARCHRMGQVRRVQVHRLLAEDSADRRMLEILDAKRGLFEAYVRDSALKTASPDAVDISDATAAKAASFAALEQQIIERECSRLGIT